MPIVILYVDDRPDLPEELTASLERDGYELLHAADAEAAVQLAREREPALAILELDLPGCDGLDLLEGLRACGSAEEGLPVVVLSRAVRSSGLHGEAIALGARDFFSKPPLASQLRSTIHEIAPPPPPEAAPEVQAPGLAGALSETPLPELLVRLRRRGAGGVLIVSRDGAQLGIQLRNGSPVAVSSERLTEAFAWTSGEYRFVEGKRLKADVARELPGDPARLIREGVLASTPAGLARDRLRKRGGLYASLADGEETAVEGVELGGESTLGELLDSGAVDERLLYALWAAGRIELHSAPTLPLLEEIAADEGPETLAGTLRGLAQRLLAADDFEVLDIPLFAPDGQVQAAYERRLAQIPEEAYRAPEPELREQATRIRKRIEAAYAHLRDAEVRRAHALLRQEEDQDRDAQTSAPRALEAERWFRKGSALLEGKRYDEAAEAFGMASHLDPGEGEYLSHLGYALYLSKPGEDVVRKEAMEHIANGIKRSPDRELPYVYLARILRAKGDTGTARKVLRRALRIKPSCHPARRELRLLEMREKKARGLLGRLLRR